MIELRKYKRLHVYRARAKRTRIYDLVRAGGEACLREKTLRSNLAPEEDGGRLFEGGV